MHSNSSAVALSDTAIMGVRTSRCARVGCASGTTHAVAIASDVASRVIRIAIVMVIQ